MCRTSRFLRSHSRATSRAWALLVTLGMLFVTSCAAPWAATAPPRTLTTTLARLTYVAVGASDTYGIGTEDPDQTSWPIDLTRQLGAGVHLVNVGFPGATVAQAQQTQLPVALAAHPDIVTVWLAVNDLIADVPLPIYQRQLQTLLTGLAQGTQAHTYVGNLPKLTLIPYFAQEDPAALDAKVRQWNAAIAAVCQTTGATLVDLYAGSQDIARNPIFISGDGLHPSTPGAELLAQYFLAAIRRTQAR